MKEKLLSRNRSLNRSLIFQLETDLVTDLFMSKNFSTQKSVTKSVSNFPIRDRFIYEGGISFNSKSVSNKKLETDLVTDLFFMKG